ncbi:deaminase domain-containing protein [Clostridiaceae bacterium M8S5]|nr:deaminase domain-containing protein [Clostridiaceae bacterium M8S5]
MSKKFISILLLVLLLINPVKLQATDTKGIDSTLENTLSSTSSGIVISDITRPGVNGPDHPDEDKNDYDKGEIKKVDDVSVATEQEVAKLLDQENITLKNGQRISVADLREKLGDNRDPASFERAIIELRIEQLHGDNLQQKDQLSKDVGDFKAMMKDYVAKKSYTQGNYASAEVHVGAFNGNVRAWSRLNNKEYLTNNPGKPLSTPENVKVFIDKNNIALLRPEEQRVFKTLLDPYDRAVDTEAKILEFVANILGDSYKVEGTLDLYTVLKPCPSCSGVISQFLDRYPNIKINVYYG